MVSPTPIISVTVLGVRPTIVALSAEMLAMSARATAGLMAAGKIVQEKARANIAPFRYDSRLHNATTVQVHVKSLNYVSVTVGVHGNTFAPEGRTFEVGWHSKKGLQPPTAPIAAWVLRRGITGSASKANSIAYVIARKQGERGYSFDERHWLSDAWAETEPMIEAMVVRYAASSWAGQARAPSGRFIG